MVFKDDNGIKDIPDIKPEDSLVYYDEVEKKIKLKEEIDWLNIRKVAMHLIDFANKNIL